MKRNMSNEYKRIYKECYKSNVSSGMFRDYVNRNVPLKERIKDYQSSIDQAKIERLHANTDTAKAVYDAWIDVNTDRMNALKKLMKD